MAKRKIIDIKNMIVYPSLQDTAKVYKVTSPSLYSCMAVNSFNKVGRGKYANLYYFDEFNALEAKDKNVLTNRYGVYWL